MLVNDSLSALIADIYDAAAEPALWPEVLDKIVDGVSAGIGHFHLYNFSERQADVFFGVRNDPANYAAYSEYFHTVNPWTAPGTEQHFIAGTVSRCGWVSERALEHSEFYTDFLKQQDVFHQVAAMLTKDERSHGLLAILRPRRLGPFTDEECAFLQLLTPHLQRAVALHQRLSLLEDRGAALQQGLDAFPQGVVFIDDAGRAVIVNRAARRILDRRDGLFLDGSGRPLASSPLEERDLWATIRAIADPGGAAMAGCRTLVISRPSGARPLQVLAVPLGPRTREAILRREALSAVLFITDPESRFEPMDAVLRRLYALTGAEARLAAEILNGHSLAEAADRLAISISTARTHLSRILDKTGVPRQSELVRALLLGPAGLHLQAG